MKIYIYRDKNTGEYLFSDEPVEDENLELVTIYEEKTVSDVWQRS